MTPAELPPQKQMTGMLGHPVAENPIDRMFDAVYAHYGLHWQFWKCDVAAEDLGAAIAGTRALGLPRLRHHRAVQDRRHPVPRRASTRTPRAIGAANWVTNEDGRLIGHNNDGKGVVKAIDKVTPIAGKRVAMMGAGGAGRAMAVELGWAGAAHLTVITRREEQGREVAELVHRAAGIPTAWQQWAGDVVVPDGTEILMNATHLGCAPALRAGARSSGTASTRRPRPWTSSPTRASRRSWRPHARGAAPIVDGVEMLVQLAMQLFETWTGVAPAEEVFQRAVAAALGE